MLNFQTERLLLRAFEESDMNNIVSLVNDPRVLPMIDISWPAPHGSTSTWMNKFQTIMLGSNIITFVVEKLDTPGEFVGHLQLSFGLPKNRDASFGIMIKPQWWSVGYGTELLKWLIDNTFIDLGLHRLCLGATGSNQRAIDLYKRIGFVVEGVDRKANWNHGEWDDFVRMAILEEDWKERKKMEIDGWEPLEDQS